MIDDAVLAITSRSLGSATFLFALAFFATSNGCGGQATSQNGQTSEADAAEPAPSIHCGPGTVLSGSQCIAAYGSGGARSAGGRSGLGGAPLTGGRTGSGGTSTGGSSNSGGATSTGGHLGTGGVPSSIPDADTRDVEPPPVTDASSNDASSNDASVVDTTPPVFAGIVTAEHSNLPGYVLLMWTAAADDTTDARGIVYAVYVAQASGQEDFSNPRLLTTPGSIAVVFGLVTRGTHYFVVRARDRAGNEDQNTIELTVELPTSFAIHVQPIFTQSCAVGVCHTVGADGTNPPVEGMNLDLGSAYASIVNVRAREGVSLAPPEPDLMRIDAASTNPMDSYLWRKMQTPALSNITGHSALSSTFAPPPTPEQVQIITDWITEGSLDD